MNVKINRVLRHTQEFIDVVESHTSDLEVTRMVDVGYYLQAQEELRTLKTAFDESLSRLQHIDHLLKQKYFEIANRWQREQRALNRHLANPLKKNRDRGATVL